MQFRHKNSLVRHLCQHTGERPHPCQICGQAFISVHRMKEHIKKYHPKAAQENTISAEEHSTNSENFASNREQTSDKPDNGEIIDSKSSLRKKKPKKRSKSKEKSFQQDITYHKNLSEPQLSPEERLNFIAQNIPNDDLVKVNSTPLHKTLENNDSKPTSNPSKQINSIPVQAQIQVSTPATITVPVMSLVQATNGQMFLLTTNQQQTSPTQYGQPSESSLGLSTSSPTIPINNTFGYLTPNQTPIQPIQLNPPPILFPPQAHSCQTQLFSNVINQNSFNTMIIGQLPSTSSGITPSTPSSVTLNEVDDIEFEAVPRNLSQKLNAKTELDMHQREEEPTKCVVTKDSQTKQSILTSYGRQHQQNISKSLENQVNTIITNITTLNSKQHPQLNQENVNVGMMTTALQQQQLTTNSIQQHQLMSLESLKQLSTTSSSPILLPSPSLNVQKQIQLSQGEIESLYHLPSPPPTTTLISVDNMAQKPETIQTDSYLFKRSENGMNDVLNNVYEQNLIQKNPCDEKINPSIDGDREKEAIKSTKSLGENESRKKINCLRGVRRKPDIEHTILNNIISSSAPQLPPHPQPTMNKVMLSGVKEDKKKISWSNYNISMKEGDKESDIDLIKRIPAQLTNFNSPRSSSLSHPSSSFVSFSNGYFRACNFTSAEGEETLAARINFGENDESLRLLEKHEESNNNMKKTGNNPMGDIIKVALVESKVC